MAERVFEVVARNEEDAEVANAVERFLNGRVPEGFHVHRWLLRGLIQGRTADELGRELAHIILGLASPPRSEDSPVWSNRVVGQLSEGALRDAIAEIVSDLASPSLPLEPDLTIYSRAEAAGDCLERKGEDGKIEGIDR